MLILATACTDDQQPSRRSVSLVALLSDNSVLLLDADGRSTALSLGEPSQVGLPLSRRILVDRATQRAYVLAPGSDGEDLLHVVDLRARSLIRACGSLGGRFRTITWANQRTVYAIGDRPAALAIVRISTDDCRIVSQHSFPLDARFDWFVYRAIVTPDERQLLVSYHGARTTGVDRFDLAADARCAARAAPNLGCLQAHGNVELWEQGVITTSGEDGLYVFDGEDRRVRKLDVGLPGDHVMEFAIADDGARAYVIGSCIYARGLSAVDLQTGSVEVINPSRVATSLCGERIVLQDADTAALLQSAIVPTRDPGTILVDVNLHTGAGYRTIKLANLGLVDLAVADVEAADAGPNQCAVGAG